MKSALMSIKTLLQLDRGLDQPSTFEAALKALEIYHSHYGTITPNMVAPPKTIAIPISLERIIPPGLTLNFNHAISDPPATSATLASSNNDLSSTCPACTFSTTLPAPAFAVPGLGLDLSLLPSLDLSPFPPSFTVDAAAQDNPAKRAHRRCPDLTDPLLEFDGCFDLAMHAIQHPSLQSTYVRCSVGLCVINGSSHILDCNQYMLDMIKAPDFTTLNMAGCQASLVIDVELMQVALGHINLPHNKTIRCLEPIRRLDGQRAWFRLVLTRMEERHDVGDPASRLSAFQHTYFMVAQEEPAPLDGRGRVWSDAHLLHMGSKQASEL